MSMLIIGDCLNILPTLESGTVNCCVTSPPYFGLRDYGMEGQIGLEKKPDEYVAKLVHVFREVRRVLRDDGTLWLNLGDSYCAGATGSNCQAASTLGGGKANQVEASKRPDKSKIPGLKQKDLIGIPWMVAFALRADGWYLRSDIIWAKPNAMPESVRDRPTRSHEYIFLLSKSAKYYYDADAIAERGVSYDPRMIDNFVPKSVNGKHVDDKQNSTNRRDKQRGHSRTHAGFNDRWDRMEKSEQCAGMRNKRDVWTVSPAQFSGAHFATFPPSLIEPCILAGCPAGGSVLDPFFGSGTTGEVAQKYGRQYVGIELNPGYAPLAKERTQQMGMSI